MRQWTVCWCVRACLLALVTLGRQRCSADSSLYTSPRTLWDDHMHVAARLCPITGARQQLHAWVHIPRDWDDYSPRFGWLEQGHALAHHSNWFTNNVFTRTCAWTARTLREERVELPVRAHTAVANA